MIAWLLEADQAFFLFLNGLHHPWLDPVMVFISGKFSWLPLYLLLLFFIIRQYGWESVRILLFIALLISMSDQLSVKAFKLVFERLRPCHEPELQGLIHLASGRCGGSFGFVSSHAANSFALASFVFLLFKTNWKYTGMFAFGWAAVVSYSRIYLGVHYPADILGGALLGIACGYFVWLLYQLSKRYLCRQNC